MAKFVSLSTMINAYQLMAPTYLASHQQPIYLVPALSGRMTLQPHMNYLQSKRARAVVKPLLYDNVKAVFANYSHFLSSVSNEEGMIKFTWKKNHRNYKA